MVKVARAPEKFPESLVVAKLMEVDEPIVFLVSSTCTLLKYWGTEQGSTSARATSVASCADACCESMKPPILGSPPFMDDPIITYNIIPVVPGTQASRGRRKFQGLSNYNIICNKTI